MLVAWSEVTRLSARIFRPAPIPTNILTLHDRCHTRLVPAVGRDRLSRQTPDPRGAGACRVVTGARAGLPGRRPSDRGPPRPEFRRRSAGTPRGNGPSFSAPAAFASRARYRHAG